MSTHDLQHPDLAELELAIAAMERDLEVLRALRERAQSAPKRPFRRRAVRPTLSQIALAHAFVKRDRHRR